MTPDTGLTIYVSSTFTDLSAERSVVIDAAKQVRVSVIEDCTASDTELGTTIVEDVTRADVFLIIVGFRYGYQLKGGLSVTETQYEAAEKAGMPILVFMLEETAPWPTTSIAAGEEFHAVKNFRLRLSKQHRVTFFQSATDLRTKAILTLLVLAEHAREPTVAKIEPEGEVVKQNYELLIGPAILEIRSQIAFLTKRTLELQEGQLAAATQPLRSAPFLGPAKPQVDRQRIFVIMPYSQPWSGGVELLICEACKSAGFSPEVSKYSEGRMIIHDIWHGITASAAVVADLSGGNANVAYEVGLADAIGREAILISQTGDVPVDFRGARLLMYENTIHGSHRLREDLQSRLIALRERLKVLQ